MRTAKWVMLIIGGGTVLFVVLLAGCVHEPRHRADYSVPPPDYVEVGGVVRDDYYYYPGYQVYYSSSRHQYIYQEGSVWVTRPAPPRVSIDVLYASPSVRLDFHDAPSIHHSRVIRDYPQHWTPPGSNHGNREGRDEDRSERNKKGGKGRN